MMATLLPRVLAGLALLLPAAANADILSAWVQHTASGLEARAVTTDAACPLLNVDGRSAAMRERTAPNAAFPVRVCAAPVLPGLQRIVLGNVVLPTRSQDAVRIVIVGDTGCRISARAHQACNDPDQWPWAQVAARAAAMRPDVVVHVGDYYYREVPCPAGIACEGPHGDHWASWDADFFAPARPLLAAAPWVMVRGNHEECARGGDGWTRLLSPMPVASACAEHEPPYAVPAHGTRLLVLDSAIARDLRADPETVALYRRDFEALAGLASGSSWLLSHHPLRGIVRINPDGRLVGGNRTLIAAQGKLPANIDLLLSGHIHVFETLNYLEGPPQIIAGNGGDNLDKQVPPQLGGLLVGAVQVTEGISTEGFGFLFFEGAPGGDWKATAYAVSGVAVTECLLHEQHIRCREP